MRRGKAAAGVSMCRGEQMLGLQIYTTTIRSVTVPLARGNNLQTPALLAGGPDVRTDALLLRRLVI